VSITLSQPRLYDKLPIGAVLSMGRPTAPSGWIACDGSTVPIATYPALHGVLQGAYDADHVARGGTVPVGHFAVPLLNTTDAYVRSVRGSSSPASSPLTSGSATHSHSITTAVNITAVTGGDHWHNVPAQVTEASGDHGHSYNAGTTGGSAAVKNDARSTNYSGNSFTIYNNATGAHTHDWAAGNSANTGANHSHSATVGTINSSGAHGHGVASITQSSHTVTLANDPLFHPVFYYMRAA
jgi:microcystin-dependent protein